jgi:hypothetical protein
VNWFTLETHDLMLFEPGLMAEGAGFDEDRSALDVPAWVGFADDASACESVE